MKHIFFKTRKLLVFVLFCLCLVLTSCGETKDVTITVNYNTNGGNEIASMTFNTEQISSFVLPQNPTKEGYDFVGWYIDSEYTTAFTTLDSNLDVITLYAKWEEKKVEDPEEPYIPTEEDLIGTWYANGTILEFKENKKAVLTMSQGTYNASYSISSAGKISVITTVSNMPLVLSGFLEDEAITFKLFGEELEFIKVGADDIERIKYPNFSRLNGIDFSSHISSKLDLNVDLGDEALKQMLEDLRIKFLEKYFEEGLEEPNDLDESNGENNDDEETEAVNRNIKATIQFDYDVSGILEKIAVDDINNLKAYLTFKGEINIESDAENFEEAKFDAIEVALSEFVVYILDGYAYVQMNLPIKEESDIEGEYTYKNEETYGYINLKELFEIVKEDSDGEIDIQKILNDIPFEMIASLLLSGDTSSVFDMKTILSMASSFGITSDMVNTINDIINSFTPEKSVDGNKTTYVLSNDNVKNGINGIVNFLKDNKSIIDLLIRASNGEAINEEDYEKLVRGLEELRNLVNDNVNIKSLKLETITEDDKINNVASDIDIEISLDQNKLFFINIQNSSEIHINDYEATIDYPDFSNYVNIAGIVQGYND